MPVTINGTTGITSPGGDTASVSVLSPIIGSASGNLSLQANSTTYATLNTIGNLGLGAAPASWGVGGPVVEFKNPGNAVFNNGASDMWLSANMVYNSGWTYGSNGKASGAEVTDGGMLVYAANTGTAGASASLTLLTSVKIGQTFALQGANQTAGTGIAFPATQSASSDANTLDDYEEGTWTPTATSQSGSITTYSASGTYTKVGKIVVVSCRINLTTVGTAAGIMSVGGMPFTSQNSVGAQTQNGLVREAAATGIIYYALNSNNANSFVIQNSTNGAIAWSNGYIYDVSLTYISAN